jgi:hypothetical protein
MTDSKRAKDASARNAGSALRAPRKPYVSPKLQVYGSVAKLTRGGNGTGQDGGTAGMQMVCL